MRWMNGAMRRGALAVVVSGWSVFLLSAGSSVGPARAAEPNAEIPELNALTIPDADLEGCCRLEPIRANPVTGRTDRRNPRISTSPGQIQTAAVAMFGVAWADTSLDDLALENNRHDANEASKRYASKTRGIRAVYDATYEDPHNGYETRVVAFLLDQPPSGWLQRRMDFNVTNSAPIVKGRIAVFTWTEKWDNICLDKVRGEIRERIGAVEDE